MKTRKLGTDPGLEPSTSENSDVGKSEFGGTAFVSVAEILIFPANESATLSCDFIVSVFINECHARETVL